jgi:hypothetical protein
LFIDGLVSQGSSFLATLGFEPESLWDSFLEFSKGIGPRFPQLPSALRHGLKIRAVIANFCGAIPPPDRNV